MDVSPEWFVAFGCALRGQKANRKDKEINLSGDGAIDTFHEERLVNFMSLWRVVIPMVLGFLLIVLFLAESFLNTIRSGIEEQPGFTQQDQESAQVSALEASSTVFNTSIAMMTNVESQISKNYLLIAEINTIATANGVTISQITFQSATTPIQVNGVAQSTDSIAAFKSAIQNDHHFGAVTLPVLNIQQNATNGGYSFSMTFPLSSGF
jgi:Tfp pilus assembly protein PilN